jgi:hypothetical protein
VSTSPREHEDLPFPCGNEWRTALDWPAILVSVASKDPTAMQTVRDYFRSGVTLYLDRETRLQNIDTYVDRCLHGLVECISLLQLRHIDDVLPILRSIVRNQARIAIDTVVENTISPKSQLSGSSEP